jgi:hypothetical protein
MLIESRYYTMPPNAMHICWRKANLLHQTDINLIKLRPRNVMQGVNGATT